MKAVIKEEAKVETSHYPCLKIFKRVGEEEHHKVVLFTGKHKGTVVHAIGSCSVLGEYYEDWKESAFEPFYGTIELSN